MAAAVAAAAAWGGGVGGGGGAGFGGSGLGAGSFCATFSGCFGVGGVSVFSVARVSGARLTSSTAIGVSSGIG